MDSNQLNDYLKIPTEDAKELTLFGYDINSKEVKIIYKQGFVSGMAEALRISKKVK